MLKANSSAKVVFIEGEFTPSEYVAPLVFREIPIINFLENYSGATLCVSCKVFPTPQIAPLGVVPNAYGVLCHDMFVQLTIQLFWRKL